MLRVGDDNGSSRDGVCGVFSWKKVGRAPGGTEAVDLPVKGRRLGAGWCRSPHGTHTTHRQLILYRLSKTFSRAVRHHPAPPEPCSGVYGLIFSHLMDSKRLNLSMAGLSCISFVGQLPTDAMIPVARSRFIMSRQFGTYRDPAQVQLKSKKFIE